MPETEVRLFRCGDGSVPLLEWLDRQSNRVRVKCLQRVEMLAQKGHELRRPHADLLRDGIYELRARLGQVHYRVLYFFHGREAVVVSHGTTKERCVDPREIDLAVRRKREYERDPDAHTARLED